jgi:predicted permease
VLSRWRTLARSFFHRRRFEDGLAEEMRFHIEQYTRDLITAGHSPEEAARRARMEFGSVENATIDCREARGLHWVDMAQMRVRYAVRVLRKNPAFTLTAVSTLALCLGATVAIFAVVDAILLRPLPFPAPDRLVVIYNTYPQAGVPDDGASVANYYERRHAFPQLAGVSLFRDGAGIIGEPGANEREYLTRVTPEFFATLGVPLARGRTFTDAECAYETAHVAIVTDTYWRDHLAADPNVIGRPLRLDGDHFTIVGLLPPSFQFLSSKRGIYIPLASDVSERGPGARHAGSSAHMLARMRDGLTLEQFQSQVDAHNAAMERTNPQAQMIADAGFRSVVIPLRDSEVASVRATLILLQAGVVALLLIGGVNVTNLFLIRASGRSREFALRQAIGASRRHLLGEIVVETLLLTGTGGVLGLVVGAWGVRLLRTLGASRLPLGAHVVFDVRVALVGLAAAVVLGLAIAVPVAWCSLRGHAAGALGSDSRTTTASRRTQHLRHAFLVAEVALAFVLLAGSGLLALSLDRVSRVDPGFRAEQVLSGQIKLPWKGYDNTAKKLAFLTRLFDLVASQPGVLYSGISTNVPFSGNTIKAAATVEGHEPSPGAPPRADYPYGVAGDYFRAMGIPLREGRLLSRDDDRPDSLSVVVDEDFARHYWPGASAIGHRLFMGTRLNANDPTYTIVGVVGAVKQGGLAATDALGAVYYPYSERFDNDVYVVVRTTGDPTAAAAMLQRLVRQVDADLPVNNLQSMTARIDNSLLTRRSPAVLAVLFAAMALLLTAIGMYGVLGYAVALRRREIGLRLALGAEPRQVRGQFLALAGRLVLIGSAAGLIGAWISGRAMRAVLFQVSPQDAGLLAGVALVLGAVCLAACLLPSHRASRIPPAEALAES